MPAVYSFPINLEKNCFANLAMPVAHVPVRHVGKKNLTHTHMFRMSNVTVSLHVHRARERERDTEARPLVAHFPNFQ